jgi:tetratricopeptide (TPR) repeat protein
MKKLINTENLILTVILVLFSSTEIFAKSAEFKYSQKDISNYFSGTISLNQNYTNESFEYLNKVQSIKEVHSNYNIKFIYSLVLLEKYEEAFEFAQSIWQEDELFFEADLLLGLKAFLKKDNVKAEKHFKRLNKASKTNIYFQDFFGNILISWLKASENKKEESFSFHKRIPSRYKNLALIQNSFLQCYFDTSSTAASFEELINNKEVGFSRYNFFLVNYLLSKGNTSEAKSLIKEGKKIHNSNLLIKQAEKFIINGKTKKITNFFSCEKTKDSIAEFLYVIANMYSTQEKYLVSNFYLKLSFLLNNRFTPNLTLLAENLYNQNKFKEAKKIFDSLKKIGEVYSWYAAKNLAAISLQDKTKSYAIKFLKKEFNSLSSPTYMHYYELANFYKANEYHNESIKYYSLALKKIKRSNPLVPKILDRRGVSYEQIGDWDNAEKDLLESIEILPDQALVLNYLAYSWIEKKINKGKALLMLKKATKLKEDNGYIIDSLGWAYYVNENYLDAEKYLKVAVQLMPLDPVINDHYGDTLWMLNKNIQARYFWNYASNLEGTTKELKDKISKKLIFGIKENL